MAVKLPDIGGPMPAPSGQQRVVQAPRDFEAQAMQGLGQSLTKAGSELGAAFEREKARIDKVRVEDAFTELRNAQIDLSVGQENGFRNLKSADAVKTQVLKDWSGRFDAAVEDITSRLENDSQKEAFRLRADVSRSQFTQDILQHVAREDGVYQTQVMDSTVAIESNMAAMNWNNPADAMASVERVKAAVNSYASANGLDAKVKEAQYIKKVSSLHASVIGQAIDNGNPEYAELWFKTNRKEIDAATASRIEGVLKEGGSRVRAQRATDDIIAMDMSESDAKKYVRKNYSGEERDEIIRRLDSRYGEAASELAAAQKSADDNAWKIVVRPGSTIDSIPPTAWAAMSGSGQKQVTEYLKARDKKDRQEDDWQMLDEVDARIMQGDITEPSQLIRYQPFFKDSTFRSLRRKVEKRGQVSASLVQRAFEDRVNATRKSWAPVQRKQWISFQSYIMENVKETKRPEDVSVWADKWFMEGYGMEDRLFVDDPDTYGEAYTKGREDFVIQAPDEDEADVAASIEALRRGGVKVPDDDSAINEFYTKHYLDASRWFGARDILMTPERTAAYALLKNNGKPITQANIEYISEQLR